MNSPNTEKVNNPNSSSNTNNNFANLTQERATSSNAIEIPSISLPKGGGALKGIDEKFEVNAANGTASFSVPLPLSPGRNGFGPSLALSYNSGGGNSPFGLGWDLGLPSIQRKTDQGLPRYGVGDGEDTFMFSSVEDLVPFLKEENDWKIKDKRAGDFTIRQYRPRIEGGFARIERIIHPQLGTFWKVTTSDNVVTFFGWDAQARIADPADNTKVFQWLPNFSYDNKGNWIQYEYKAENLLNVPHSLAEHNRHQGLAAFTNLYLKRIRYGNQQAYYANSTETYHPALPTDSRHFFEVIFDYGEHRTAHTEVPTYEESSNGWPTRPEPFSSYRSGFEIRTYRRCLGILMYHRFFEEEGFETPYLVRSMDLHYAASSINQSGDTEVSYLQSITQRGYIKDGESYSKKNLPPLEFEYQRLDWNKEIKTVSSENIINAPVGLTNNYQWVDFYGEGISGILTEQADAWYYKSNQGDVEEDGQVVFSKAQKVAPKPSYMGLGAGILSLQDLEANGQKQIVVQNERWQGYFELDQDEDWHTFQAFSEVANINLNDPNTRLLDLNGDGQADLVMTEERVFSWYEANGKKGHRAAQYATKPFDEEHGPAIVFADQQQTIFLADMVGDGLTDIVRIRNGEICYWANKGYGSFSAKINMDNAPIFDLPELFNPQYLHLADVSGTGATDIIYLGKNRFKAFINLSGNAWSEPHEIEPFCPVDSNSRLSVIDLLGTGTSCIVWSSDLPGHRPAPMRYIDLMNSKKPHVMIKQINNMGKETTVEYRSSTWYYLKDKQAGKPWITTLPFPVQVVAKTIIEDQVTDVRFTSQYSYHHGYYDHPEREFRGFGMVEQLDTEAFEVFKKSGATNVSKEELYQPPVLTKTWFHTGAFLNREKILTHFKKEYWYEHLKEVDAEIAPIEYELPDAFILGADHLVNFSPADLSADEYREALRACKGMILRQEVFGLDAKDEKDVSQQIKQLTPYTVSTHNCEIQVLQQRGENPYAVFIVKESESITYAYERNPTDPRIAHMLNLETDEYGNVLEAVSVVYPRIGTEALLENSTSDTPAARKAKIAGRAGQAKMWVTYSKNDLTNDIIDDSVYQLRQGWQTQTYELTGFTPAPGESIFKLDDFKNKLANIQEIPYHKAATSGEQKRLIEHLKTQFYDDELNASLPDGQQGSWGISYENYQLAYTPELLDDIFQPSPFSQAFSVSDADMQAGKFILDDAQWWIRSGIVHFRAENDTIENTKSRFFTPIAYTDPFDTRIEAFPDPYFLFMEKSVDPLLNESRILHFNYRTLSPDRMLDINDNISSVIVDELGLVKASAVAGKAGANDGDDLQGLTAATEPEQNLIDAFFATAQVSNICDYDQLQAHARELLKNAGVRMIYDFHQTPTVVASIAREKHQDVNSPLQISFEYSDGLGNVAMTKVQAESGFAKKAILQVDGNWQIEEVPTGNQLRWVGNGRTVLNNKGNPIKQYEPYFSVTPAFENAAGLVESGVTPILYYDAPGRLIKTELPNGTFTKVTFDAWKQISYDANDTVEDSDWYEQRKDLDNTDRQKLAAIKAAVHHDTPAYLILDTLGRPTLSVDHNRTEADTIGEFYYTHSEIDIEGNALSVTDARGNIVMAYRYDMLGHRVAQTSMDAGNSWMLNNALGNPVKSWDERGHEFSYEYDVLQRPIAKLVKGGENNMPITRYEYIIYGEGHGDNPSDDKVFNLRGKPVILYDTAGKVTTADYDFKGNLLTSSRTFAKDYKKTPNWPDVDPDSLLIEGDDYTFTSITEYDALNRPTKQIAPDGRITIPQYNPAAFLEKVILHKDASDEDGIEYVKNINYDAKGQRTRIQYGNGVSTRYDYEPETFRLTKMYTTRLSPSGEGAGGGPNVLQDLNYAYDPTGNIIQIEDKAIPVQFFNNQKIEGKNEYTYDALYRLIYANGRESNNSPTFNAIDNWKDEGIKEMLSSGAAMQTRIYHQHYQYDSVGNILEMCHKTPGYEECFWKRTYTYESKNNRLRSTSIGNQTYLYPHHAQHGYINDMPHLSRMDWSFKEELQATSQQVINNGDTPETTWYVYDGSGERVRKITENKATNGNPAVLKEERLYLGSLEVYKKHSGNNNGLERTTLHLMDDQRRIAMIDTRNGVNDGTDSQTIRYQLGNHLGSSSIEVNETAEVISYEEYHPYGTTAFQAKNASIKAAAKRYRYTGMERDEETGMNYHSARYYLVWLGRWLSTDPIGIGDGGNLYGYVQNNPIILHDFSGLDAELSVDQDTHTVTYTATYHVVGSEEELNRLKPAADKASRFYKDSSGTTYIDGVKWTVKYDVKFVYHDTADSAGLREIIRKANLRGPVAINSFTAFDEFNSTRYRYPALEGFRDGDNVIVFGKTEHGELGTARRTRENRDFIKLNSAENQETEETFRILTHEIGHTLGFDDRYSFDRSSSTVESHSGFSDNFMSARDLGSNFEMSLGQRRSSAEFAIFVANGKNLNRAKIAGFAVDDTSGGKVEQYDPRYRNLQRTLKLNEWTRHRRKLSQARLHQPQFNLFGIGFPLVSDIITSIFQSPILHSPIYINPLPESLELGRIYF